jgi:hypothetical protein
MTPHSHKKLLVYVSVYWVDTHSRISYVFAGILTNALTAKHMQNDR